MLQFNMMVAAKSKAQMCMRDFLTISLALSVNKFAAT